MSKMQIFFKSDDPNENYLALANAFYLIVEKFAPLKKNSDHALFITKDI